MSSTISAHEFLNRFPNEKAARLHLEQRRWNGSPSCPRCGCADSGMLSNVYKADETYSGVAA